MLVIIQADLGSDRQGKVVNQGAAAVRHFAKKAVDNAAKRLLSTRKVPSQNKNGRSRLHFRSRMALGTDRPVSESVGLSSGTRTTWRRGTLSRMSMRRNGAKNCRPHEQTLQHELRRLHPMKVPCALDKNFMLVYGCCL